MTITSKKQMARSNTIANMRLDSEVYSHIIEMYNSAKAPKFLRESNLNIEMNPQQRFVADVLILANLARNSGVIGAASAFVDENWQSQIIMAGIKVLRLESARLNKRGDLESLKLSRQCMLSCASLCKSAQFILVDRQTKVLIRAIQKDALNNARQNGISDSESLLRHK